jgi:hypothetical protein
MAKKRDLSSKIAFLNAALVLLGWIGFVFANICKDISVYHKLILLMVARVLPQALHHK